MDHEVFPCEICDRPPRETLQMVTCELCGVRRCGHCFYTHMKYLWHDIRGTGLFVCHACFNENAVVLN